MYAAVLTYDLKSGKRDDFTALVNSSTWDEMVALLRQVNGFKHIYGLMKEGSDKTLTVAVYETEADALAAYESPKVKEVWAKLTDYVDMSSITRDVYEIVAEG